MIRSKFSVMCVLAMSCGLAACSGLKNRGGGGGGGNSTGSVALTMVADTLPAHPAIISLRVSVSALSLNSSGSPQTITLATPVNVDLMRLQTDTLFLGTLTKIPASNYTGVTLGLGTSVHVTFFNDTGTTINGFSPACVPNAICEATVVASGSPTATVAFTVAANGVAGVGLDLNLRNVVSLTGGGLSVSFGNANTLTAFALPRANSNLATGNLDLIEDFSGIATVAGNVLTVTSPVRGALSVTAGTGSIFDRDPSGSLCANATTLAACVSNGQIVSVDAVVKSDGTLAIQEVEPVFGSTEDIVEGVIVVPNLSNTQFGIVITDKPATLAQNSLIGSINVGDVLTVNIPGVSPFVVDTKGLNVQGVAGGVLSNFQGATDTTALRPGQVVALHVTSFNGGTTPPAANANVLTLRWSRFTGTPVAPFTPSLFNISGFPSFFPSGTAEVQVFTGTQGTQGVTNVEGISDTSQINAQRPVAIRALFIENPTNTATPAFFAGKVRQH